MGNANYRHMSSQVSVDPRTYLQSDLPKFIYHEKIGNGKFLKTYLMKIDGTAVAVKVYLKPADENIDDYAATLTTMWNALSPLRHPSLLPYQMWIKSSSRIAKPLVTPIFLVRQFFTSNLYDRLSTRPFLTDIEKLWVLYQLMRALEECHAEGMVHGDIKPENVMVTSWNWIVLTDFAPYKPVLIPDDDPTDFHYFFDSMGRRRCYVAPERFYKSGDLILNPESNISDIPAPATEEAVNSARDNGSNKYLSPAMDVFSLGCTMAEVLLDGKPLLDLPSMLKYKSCCEDPSFSPSTPMTSLLHPESPAVSALGRIKDSRMKEVIGEMTQHSPGRRMNVAAYRSKLDECGVFPKYFEATLYKLFVQIHWEGKTPDDRIGILCQNYSSIVADIAECRDLEGERLFRSILHSLRSQRGTSQHQDATDSRKSSESNSPCDIGPSLAHVDLKSARKRNSEEKELKSSVLPDGSRKVAENPCDTYVPQLSEKGDGTAESKLLDIVKDFETIMEDARCKRVVLSKANADGSTGEALDNKESELQKGSDEGTYSRRVFNVHGDGSKLFAVDFSSDEKHASEFQATSLSPYAENVSKIQQENRNREFKRASENISDGILLVVQVICSSIRHLRHPQSKVASLMLLTRLGALCSDVIILERIVPFVTICFEDQVAMVRATAIRCLRCLLNSVSEISQVEANIFKEFIFPVLNNVITRDSEPIVRIAFAESIGRFAETAMRFLDASRFIHQSKSMPPSDSDSFSTTSLNGNDATPAAVLVDGSYDAQVAAIHDQVNKWIRDLVLDGTTGIGVDSRNDFRYQSRPSSHGSIVKRAILEDVVRLCQVFGKQERIMDLFAQLVAYVNHQDWELDWELRNAFCIKIPMVCAFLGGALTGEYVLPILEKALEKARVDPHEIVVSSAVKCVWALIEMGLLSKPLIVDAVSKPLPLLVHPSNAIRENTIGMIAAAAKYFGVTDSYVYLLPQFKPLLTLDLVGVEITPQSLKSALCTPLSRTMYQQAMQAWPDSLVVKASPITHNTGISSEVVSTTSVVLDVDHQEESNGGDDEDLVRTERESLKPSQRMTDVSKSGAKNDSSKAACSTITDEDATKLLFIQSYINAVLSESPSRMFQNKEGAYDRKGTMTGQKRHASAIRQGNAQLGFDSLLDLFSYQTLASLPEHLVQSLLVPHQKYSLHHSTTDELRQVALDNESIPCDFSLIKRAYGITINQADAARALAEGDPASEMAALSPAPHQHRPGSSTLTGTPVLSDQNNTRKNGEASIAEVEGLNRKIKAMKIPPLSPDFGTLVQTSEGRQYRPYSMFIESLDTSFSSDSQPGQTWRPKENNVVSTMFEHNDSVNRIAVSQDQTFFVSASSDGSAKVWQVKGLDRNALPRSAKTYSKHTGKVLDAAIIENSHSVATCSDDSAIHVWRVELGSSRPRPHSASGGTSNHDMTTTSGGRATQTSITGVSDVKVLDASEGPILSVQHFTGDTASVLTYVTRKGMIHSWDLRSSQEPFQYPIRPELGYPTTLACSSDRNWICVGTSLGFVGLWDIRYNVLCKLWRHSSYQPIHRLACAKSSPGYHSNRDNALTPSEGAYLFVAAGRNETAVWGVPEGGECLKCFRSVPMTAASKNAMSSLPRLHDIAIPSHSLAPLQGSHVGHSRNMNLVQDHTVRAIMGRISQTSTSYVVTAGTDRNIRYWDFNAPNKCFTVSGLDSAQPKPVYETPNSNGLRGKLFLCYDSAVPSVNATLQSQLPLREYRGMVPPVTSFKDAIVDLKMIDLPIKMMISAARDGEIKLWR